MSATPSAGASRAGLALICSAQFVLVLDVGIANVALAKIEAALHFAPSELQWVVTGYALTFGSLLIFGGRLGDRIGHRTLLIYALSLFGLASLAAGLSPNAGVLVASRIAQGAGAALVAPSALAMLTALYGEGHARTRALGYFQAAASAGGTAGIVLGGVLTQYVGWRSVFLVNPPIIITLVVLMRRHLPTPVTRRDTRLDVAGATLITGAIAGVIFALSEGQQHGFGSWEMIAGSTVCIVSTMVLVATERRSAAPMFPRGIIAVPQRRAALIAAMTASAILGGYLYFLVLFLERVLHYSAVRTGLSLLPSSITVMISGLFIARRVLARLGVKATLTIGLLLMVAGMTELSRMTAHSSYLIDVTPGLILTALGTGLVMLAASVAATDGVDHETRGLIGGLFVTAQNVGPAVGLAVFATAAAARTRAEGGRLVPGYQLSYWLAGATGLIGLSVVLFQLRRVSFRLSRPAKGPVELEPDEPEVAGLASATTESP